MKNILFIFILSLSIAQVFSEYSYTGASQAGMVGTITANVSSDVGLFYNPASLSGFESNTLIAGQANIFNQSHLPYKYIGLVYQAPIIGRIGISYQSFSTDYNGVELSSENVFSISKGKYFQKDRNSSFSIGYRIKFLSWEQSESAGATGDGSDGFSAFDVSTMGLDFGVIGGLRDRYWVGGYLTNINSPSMGGQNLPRKISISLGFNPYDKVKTNLSMERLLGRNDRQIKFGLKYNVSSALSIVSGVQSNPNRFGFGFEYEFLNKFILGYSILTHHIMNETHHFEIKIK